MSDKSPSEMRAESDKFALEKAFFQATDLVTDEERIKRLYEIAVEVCLKEEPEVQSGSAELSPEAKLVRELGVRGVGTALELVHGWYSPEDSYYMEEDCVVDEQLVGSVYVGRDTPLRRPRMFGSAQSPEITARIEALGTGLLAESYKTLGTDVKEHVKILSEAATDEDQIVQIEWLHRRLAGMESKDELSAGSAPDKLFYHPARLSAKGIGIYPHLNTTPTCLMKSIIASSFFENAGLPHVHCGVMGTDITEYNMTIARTAQWLRMSLGDILPQPTKDKLHELSVKNIMEPVSAGMHSVAAVQLRSGAWFVVDPNYSSNYKLNPASSERVTAAYNDLTDLKVVAPGMELAVPLTIGTDNAYHHEREFFEIMAMAVRSTSIDREAVKDILTSNACESIMARILQVVQDTMIFHTDEREESLNKIMKALATDELHHGGEAYSSVLYACMEELWNKYVLWEMDEQSVLDRCKNDPEFLGRRLDDIANLPALALIPALMFSADEAISVTQRADNNVDYHRSLEVGLPATRIGSTVLSDFAVYLAPGEIAPSTWNGNWGSRIAITEHGYYNVSSNRLTYTTDSANAWLAMVLKYFYQNGIISKSRLSGPQEDEE